MPTGHRGVDRQLALDQFGASRHLAGEVLGGFMGLELLRRQRLQLTRLICGHDAEQAVGRLDRPLGRGHGTLRPTPLIAFDSGQEELLVVRQRGQRPGHDGAGLSHVLGGELQLARCLLFECRERLAGVGVLRWRAVHGEAFLGRAAEIAVGPSDAEWDQQLVAGMIVGQALAGVQLEPAPTEIADDQPTALSHELADRGDRRVVR